ncbi:hypothetical protein FCM35_KLT03582 [Carex littledalei]|uniref:DUF4283 domain-containing protein n=1 Tax=Carex littledalei TaxID=544730 RepID=A0A833R2K6_9POAL|nr:hypothetical protein FCM35_KLT03582 [Carex littledalei]
MEIPYPYGDTIPNSISVFAPNTPQSTLLENDLNHSICACFFHRATNRNPAFIQSKLAQQYGGQNRDYHVHTLSHKSYLFHIPEILNIEQILQDLLLWSNSHIIHLGRWNEDEGWNINPIGFKVYLQILNFPLQLWHPKYFHLMVAGFGSPLYVDDENTLGFDRSTLRIAIRCVDPSKIPEVIILHYDDKWRRCIVAVLGWSINGYSSNGVSHEPESGGRQLDYGWPREGPPITNLKMK